MVGILLIQDEEVFGLNLRLSHLRLIYVRSSA